MKRLLTYKPLHFAISLIIGILIQFYSDFWAYSSLLLISTLVVFAVLVVILKDKIITTILSFLLFVLVGISSVYINDDSKRHSYFIKHSSSNSTICLRIIKVLKPSFNYAKYEGKVIQVDSLKTAGKILVNIGLDSLSNPLNIDDVIFTKSEITTIKSPLNPHQFNYKSYLLKSGIEYQIFIDGNSFKQVEHSFSSIQGLAAKFRYRVQKSLRKHNFRDDEFGVINALLLGQRQEISSELQKEYAKAGAIHILAVSGLHVGIILIILTQLLKPLERFKRGKLFKSMLIILLLWTFAFVAGLSASVVRAVTMFTFVAIGMTFKRKGVITFSLISSLFLLLIVKPMFIFDVGFQLSYLAVFGIVWIQPNMAQFYKPKFYLDKKIWEIITVSCAAQIAILPLSLYYFHQFPSLFLISNLFIIPVLGIILFGGIVIITLALLDFLPSFLSGFYSEVIATMNNFISWIASKEDFLFTEISISALMTIIIYLTITLALNFLIRMTSKNLVMSLMSILLLQIVYTYEDFHKKRQQEFTIFHKSRNSIVGQRFGKQQFIYHDLDSATVIKNKMLQLYRVGESVKQNYFSERSNIFKINNKTSVLVVDSLGVYQIKGMQNPIVLLQYSPKINLFRLINMIKPREIIVDGSNYKSYVNSWRRTCAETKTPFYYTGEKGAYRIRFTK